MMANSGTLLPQLRRWARARPNEVAYRFLPTQAKEDVRALTYLELDEQVRAVAACLQAEGAAGERVLLLLPTGLEYILGFLGCLFAGAVAVPAYPTLEPSRRRRVETIAAQSGARYVLALRSMTSRLDALGSEGGSLASARHVAFEAAALSAASDWRPPAIDSNSLAFLQYTSGSTAEPKGVMVTHGNLAHNEEAIRRAMGHSEGTSVVSWLPPYHDMGLIGSLLQPLYVGGSCTFMSPGTFVRRPLGWLEAISRYAAHTSGGPDFGYRICVDRTTSEERASLDLTSWKVAFVGAEPIRPRTLDRFVEAFAPCGFQRESFFPCYGLAEATLMASATRVVESPRYFTPDEATLGGSKPLALVGCGRTLVEQRLAIVDPVSCREIVSGGVGEIWLSGPSIAAGYWQQPLATAETFGARIAETGEGPFLRTGDLGFVRQGELFVTGRLKDLLVIRGRNLYPQDIEWSVSASHPALSQGNIAAFSVEEEHEERLVVAAELPRRTNRQTFDEAASAARDAVSTEFGVTVQSFVGLKLGSIPVTSSGKIERRRCRALFLGGRFVAVGLSTVTTDSTLDGVFPLTRSALSEMVAAEKLTAVESAMVTFVARMVKRDAAAIDREQSLMGVGMDSLMTVQMQHALERDLRIQLDVGQLFATPTIAQCAKLVVEEISRSSRGEAPLPEPCAETEHPLSYGQQALWFLHHLAPRNSAYAVAQTFIVRGALNSDVLARSLQFIVERHPSLRTTFLEQSGRPLQRTHDEFEVTVERAEVDGLTREEILERTQALVSRPFDLAAGPLFRVGLVRSAAEEHFLLLCTHHIVADGWSLLILVRELAAIYTAFLRNARPVLPELPIRYADYARRQREGVDLDGQTSYWRHQLAGLTGLELPTDVPRRPRNRFRGAQTPVSISDEIATRVRAFARSVNATPFMILLAALKVVLRARAGQSDIAIGTDFLNRTQAATANVIGHFVNQLVLRTQTPVGVSFRALVERVREVVLEAIANKDVPFSKLVAELNPERVSGMNPLFQVMFTFRSVDMPAVQLGQASMEPIDMGAVGEKFDLTLALVDGPRGIAGWLGYNEDLFEVTTVAQIGVDFVAVVAAATEAPDLTLAELSPRLPHQAARPTSVRASLRDIRPKQIRVEGADLVKIEELGPRGALRVVRCIQNDVDPIEWLDGNRAEVASELLKRGAVLLRDFNVSSPAQFESVARSLCTQLIATNEHQRQNVGAAVYTPVAYPSDKKLLWHNENSFNNCWPSKLLFCCLLPAPTGGETPVVDSREVLRRLDPGIRRRFEAKRVMYVRNYRQGVGLSWQTIFATDDPSAVERQCVATGFSFQWTSGGGLRTTCVRPAVIEHPQTGEESWFNQAQHWHPSCLDPEVRDSLLGLYRKDDLPRNCLYGDGSAIEDSVMQEILRTYADLEVSFSWRRGDVLLLDNILCAHGRNPFTGDRKLLVALGEEQSYPP